MNLDEWPDNFTTSMAPFGYVVRVRCVERTETSVRYRCEGAECTRAGATPFEAGFDPRDMEPAYMFWLFKQHMDQAH